MFRDIEQLTADLQRAYPGITVDQVREPGAGDEDGLWCVRHPAALTDVQVISGTGDAPFLVESELAPPTPARSVENAVRLVVDRLGLRASTS
jgi:hypothetical protein